MKKWEKYIGIPYKHLGRDWNGCDCYGIAMLYYKELLDIELKDWWYEPNWSKLGKNHMLNRAEELKFIKVEEPRKHDLVLMKLDITAIIPNHLAIVVKVPNIAISGMRGGVRVMDLNSSAIKKRIEGYYRCQN